MLGNIRTRVPVILMRSDIQTPLVISSPTCLKGLFEETLLENIEAFVVNVSESELWPLLIHPCNLEYCSLPIHVSIVLWI
jgi:hypothetical protein